ncbi:MAG: flagellar protein FlaG [Proteobacteria bacterium]|nr:flagellar protein FlaG [Pseudomonadota bacterium]
MEIQATGNSVPSSTPAVPQKSAGVAASEIPAAVKPAPVTTAAAVQQAAPPPNLADVTQAVRNINRAMQEQSQDLEFSIDKDSKRTIVKIIDQKTKEVLRQIPSVEALEIAKALDQMKGLLIHQQA